MADERADLIDRLRAQRHHADDWRTDLAELAADLLERDGARIAELEAELAIECAGQAPPESEAEHEARLMRFYCVGTRGALLRAMERHIAKLQEQIPRPLLGEAYRHTPREG